MDVYIACPCLQTFLWTCWRLSLQSRLQTLFSVVVHATHSFRNAPVRAAVAGSHSSQQGTLTRVEHRFRLLGFQRTDLISKPVRDLVPSIHHI